MNTPELPHYAVMSIRILSCLAVSLFMATRLLAHPHDGGVEKSILDNLQVHGFLSQAIVKTSDNRWFGDSPDTSYSFTEAALNGSYRITPKLFVSGQVLMRLAGDMYNGAPVLDFGLADLTLASSMNYRLGIRAGRIKNPLGLYNETRDVPFTRPGIFLPQVIYFEKVRNLLLSSDGMMVYADAFREFGDVSIMAGGGRPNIDENVEWAYFNNDFPGDLEPDSPSAIARIWFSSPSKHWNFGISGASLNMRFEPERGPAPTLFDGTTDLLFGIASFQYDAEKWTISAEYAYEPIEWRGYGPLSPDRDATGDGWYVQAQYRISPQLEVMARWEEGYGDTSDRDGSDFERATGGLFPAYSLFSKILTAGVRYDINENWMVRAEYAYHNGTFILSPRENPDFRNQTKYWNMVAFQLAFRF